MDDKKISRYFEENAMKWLEDAYVKSDYTYPIGVHRSRIAMRILTQRFGSQSLNLLDIGCGGGDLCFLAAEAGYQATGIDSSKAMLSHAENCRHTFSDEIQSRVRFVRADLRTTSNGLPKGGYDAVAAMGVLYYLSEDADLFTCARDLLSSGGILMVSCRNRLFNMVSTSDYTVKEIEGGSALDLITEIGELCHSVSQDQVARFIENLEQTISQIPSNTQHSHEEHTPPTTQDEVCRTPGYTFDVEGRQHTPSQLAENAAKFGFVNIGYYGVHPHLLIPKLNRSLPPQVFNQLSDCLCAFEDLPISLIWSSQFIGVFQKQ
jgi:2-polyprenyl-3-methyl-5-hydroxy-6-metoxy-1,4-benzoquinol methylase